MERIINLHIEKLAEGFYLATSKDMQGLVAQGRTITETLEIARDVAKKLIEAQQEEKTKGLLPISDRFDYPIVIGV
jgi:predicted RNase H-like HicB family nuclease